MRGADAARRAAANYRDANIPRAVILEAIRQGWLKNLTVAPAAAFR